MTIDKYKVQTELEKWEKVHYMSPGKDRGLKRSVTFKGIADAMAKQWGILPITHLMGK